MDQQLVDQPPAEQPPVEHEHARNEEQRRTLWRTAWGVMLAASAAFSIGYGASRSANPSVGASRPPAWPLFISAVIVVVSIWFVLAPRLHRWPFEDRPTEVAADGSEPWLAELTETEDPDEAPLGSFRVETTPEPHDHGTG